MVGEVKRHLHTGVAAADDEHLLTPVAFAAAVVAGVHDQAPEGIDAVDVGHDGLGVLTRGDDKPFGAVYPGDSAAAAVDGADAPEVAVVLGADDGLAEERPDAEGGDVVLEVSEELLPGWVGRVAWREGH